MKAKLLLHERHVIYENAFAEMVVWLLPSPMPGSRHNLKYRLALVINGQCVLRYDNEAGKGDHRHLGEVETSYTFRSPRQLLDDFWAEVENWSF